MRSRASSSRLGGAAAAGRRRRVLFQDSGSGRTLARSAALVPAPVELKRGTGSSTNRSPNLQHCKALWIIRVSSAAIARGRDLPGETGQRSTASRTVEPADCKEGDQVKSSDPLRVLQSNLASDANLVRGGFGNS